MKCPHCGKILGQRICPSCQGEILEESLFCHRCGAKVTPSAPETPSSGDDPIDFSNRVLCSDGSCIGVVNEQGICKVCGKPYRGEAK